MTKKESNILLFSITLCWAASYLFIKNLPDDFSSYAYLTLTCGIAAILMAVIFWRQLMKLKKSTWIRGFLLSLILTMNLLTEKAGISRLAPSNASFLAALTIILVPVLLLFLHQKPTKNNILGAVIIGIGLCVSTGFTVSGFYNTGSLYMLAGCFFSALIGFLLWYIEDASTFRGITYTRELLSNIIILAFFAKAYAYIVLMFSQKYTDAVSVTVIASTEPVITLGLSVLLPAAYGEGKILRFPP